jgi:hypothetical protein
MDPNSTKKQKLDPDLQLSTLNHIIDNLMLEESANIVNILINVIEKNVLI